LGIDYSGGKGPKVTTKVKKVVGVGSIFEEKQERLKTNAEGEFKKTWLWVEGWRGRLRAGWVLD
jgi:hypothetical protein